MARDFGAYAEISTALRMTRKELKRKKPLALSQEGELGRGTTSVYHLKWHLTARSRSRITGEAVTAYLGEKAVRCATHEGIRQALPLRLAPTGGSLRGAFLLTLFGHRLYFKSITYQRTLVKRFLKNRVS